MRTKLTLLGLFFLTMGSTILAPELRAQAAPALNADEKRYVAYRIARGDQLGVAVFGEQDLTTGQKRVDQKGAITLTLIGEVRVIGLTVPEAQTAIENSYRDGRFLRSPQVTVTVEASVPRWVSISGKINVPGKHEMPTDTVWTLKDLIIKAGGLQETARGTQVRITRTMPDGKPMLFIKDVESLLKARGNASAADAGFILEPEDIVYVPEKII